MTDAVFLEPSIVDRDIGATPADVHHLGWLEAEAIHILREVAGQCRNPALLFSGGKDSLVLLRLAEKAFRPGPFPFPLLHIDTGHNFPEVIAFRDRRAAELGERLIVRSVEDSIARGRVLLARLDESRNRHQSVTLLDAIEEFGFDACIGGARPRDGETIEEISVRFRTVGDITCTAPVASDAATLEAIIAETATTTITERGATRLDDQTHEASMELRKREGYF